ncbi:translocation/assembly module TamB domain-containing protein [Flexithrix dorotheae]|uniref:translocation/assembly module TamB domain-containing protein n=1 Tax=Flexithrix dorotheae TaxID=70993 RepID=UPI00037D546A|nr:translocation/assembly module TamB [Flexithrix dorotheae]
MKQYKASFILKIWKYLFRILTGGIVLLILLFFSLKIPNVQQLLVESGVAYLKERLGVEVRIEKLYIDFPTHILLENIYLENPRKDTVLYGEKIELELDMTALFHQEIKVENVSLTNVVYNLERTASDSVFNFQFIIDAFKNQDTVPDPPKESSKKLIVSPKNLQLNNVRFWYSDEIIGFLITANVGEGHIRLNNFDMWGMDIEVDSLKLKNTIGGISFNGLNEEETESDLIVEDDTTSNLKPFSLNIKYANVTLDNVAYNVILGPDDLKMYYKMGYAHVDQGTFDLLSQTISGNNFIVKNPWANLQFPNSLEESSEPVSETYPRDFNADKFQHLPTGGWTISVDGATMENGYYQMDFGQGKAPKNVVDYGHLYGEKINLSMENVLVSEAEISGRARHFSFKERSGFVLENFSSEIKMTNESILVEKANLQTKGSRLSGDYQLTYPSLLGMAYELRETGVNLKIKPCRIKLEDIYYFFPQLKNVKGINLNRLSTIGLEGEIAGGLRELNLKKVRFTGLKELEIQFSGVAKNLLENNLQYHVSIDTLIAPSEDIFSLVPDTLIPQEIRFPEYVSGKAILMGNREKVSSEIHLITSFGNISTSFHHKPFSELDRIVESGNLSLHQFNVGKLLRLEEYFGEVNLSTRLDIELQNREDFVARIDMNIDSAYVYQYPYADMNIRGIFEPNSFFGKATVADPNLGLSFEGEVNLKDSLDKIFKFDMVLNHANFQKLKIMENDLAAQFNLQVDLNARNFYDNRGSVKVSQLNFLLDDRKFLLDSGSMTTFQKPDTAVITLNSEVFTGKLVGNVNLIDLSKTLSNHIRYYFDFQDEEKFVFDSIPREMTFEYNLVESHFFTDFLIPELKEVSNFFGKGKFNSEKKLLTLDSKCKRLVYNQTTLDSLNLNFFSDKEAFYYDIGLKELYGDKFLVKSPKLSGEVKNDIFLNDISFEDADGNLVFLIGTKAESQDSLFQLSFIPGKIIFDSKKFQVPANNYLKFGSSGLQSQQLEFTYQDQAIKLRTEGIDKTGLDLEFLNFSLPSLKNVMEEKVQLFHGFVNGKIGFQDIEQGDYFANLKVKDFQVLKSSFGDINLKFDSRKSPHYDFSVDMLEKEKDLKIEGKIKKSNFDTDLSIMIKKFDLASVEIFLDDYLKELKGNFYGEIDFEKKQESISTQGALAFNDTRFRVKDLNASYRLENERITFDKDEALFSNFAIKDSLNKPLIVNGKIKYEELLNPYFNLEISADKFISLNSHAEMGFPYFGKVIMGNKTKINGFLEDIKVNTILDINKETSLVYKIVNAKETADHQGIVEFFDEDFVGDSLMITRNEVKKEPIKLDFNAGLKIDKGASLQIIIDEQAGDILELKGGGGLNFEYDEFGNMNLTGVYEIEEGNYNMNFYKLLNREFDIDKGSKISWAGDPLEGRLDITAIYSIKAAPLGLVSNVMRIDESQANQYRRPMQFYVYLIIKGELDRPEISFDIKMPQELQQAYSGTVYSSLQKIKEDESDLNKQVFALLMMNTFLSDGNASSAGNAFVTSNARNSVSQILSNQLNQLSDQVIKGVDVNFDLRSYEDRTSGSYQTRTDLEMQITKGFFNDRITVELGSNFILDGSSYNQGNQNHFAGNVDVEYKVTEDGRYRLKAYRKNENQDIIEGEYVATGISFLFIKNYNKFKELFARKKKKELRKEKDKKNKSRDVAKK